MRPLRPGPALLALSLAACSGDSPAASKPPVRVSVTASAAAPTWATPPGDSVPVLTCDVTLHAVATGPSGAGATWVGERFRFYAGPGHDEPADSFDV
jgi:hypothetical protein